MKTLTEVEKTNIESQIELQQKAVSYDIREFTIEYYVNKYLENEEKDENEFVIFPLLRTLKSRVFI